MAKQIENKERSHENQTSRSRSKRRESDPESRLRAACRLEKGVLALLGLEIGELILGTASWSQVGTREMMLLGKNTAAQTRSQRPRARETEWSQTNIGMSALRH